jgi:hypothetical protein
MEERHSIMRMEIKLPAIVKAKDYHEIFDAEKYFRMLNKKMRVKELGLYEGYYVGIAYEHGTLKEPECQIMMKEIQGKTL